MTPHIVPLKGTVRHYDWGGVEFLAGLLGVPNPEGAPFAELWFGAHPNAPSLTAEGALDEVIRGAPEAILGASTAARFRGRLPYLLKVLDARHMLSVQAHPNREQAAEGFRRENAAGIPLEAPHRNYRDDNHKPEVLVALTDFRLLRGFQPLERIAHTLSAVAELRPLLPYATSLPNLYSTLMTMPRARVDALLAPLVARLEREAPADKNTAGYWVLRAAGYFARPDGGLDRGIFFFFLLNLLCLRPGQGNFQPAGVLHTYLEGTGIELMANSDNVLRGGLTSKHVDTGELMRTLSFAGGMPGIVEGEAVSPAETVYRTPAEEFELSRIQLRAGEPAYRRTADGPDLLLVLEGSAAIACQRQAHAVLRGEAVLAPHGCAYSIEARAGRAVLFKASVPRP